MNHRSWEQTEGSSFPLGATLITTDPGINFAIYSKHATRVELLLFTPADVHLPCLRYVFDFHRNKSGPVWHCRLPLSEIGEARFYGYQIDGLPPADQFQYHFFDSEKLLLDPYAKVIYFPAEFDRQAAREPGSNIGRAPLGELPHLQGVFDWQDDQKPHHDHDLVIYEMHIKGFTANSDSGVSENRRGTFAGVIEKIPYLVQLGITAVELLPVFQFDPQEDNYWGYMPLSFFAPHRDYAIEAPGGEPLHEFRTMVRALHAAGIEVILDAVYNHTCEAGLQGPTYSLKGIDNSTYYMLDPTAADPFVNFSGTGNTMHTVNAATRQLIIDSLRYWTQELHVDGFRFDLASIFTRYPDGRINTDDPPIFSQIAAENDLEGLRLIAEPWDAIGTQQLGRKFPGRLWLQWNADFRDTVQRFVRGDRGQVPDLMTRVYGSCDLFPDDRLDAFRPRQSVNYLDCHDGMTLFDLVSYNVKNNWANGHENLDGPTEYRWNCGWEGEVHVPDSVASLRKQQIKNFLAILLLSNGTPMFRMGDEFLQTQSGNSNPYNQDNETSWLDWSRRELHADMFRFFQLMIAFRKSHPSISRSRFWRNDVHWYGAGHDVDLSESSQALAWCLHGSSQQDDDLYVMVNSHDYELEFGIHEGAAGQWRRVVDTSGATGEDIFSDNSAPLVNATHYIVRARSVVVLIRRQGLP